MIDLKLLKCGSSVGGAGSEGCWKGSPHANCDLTFYESQRRSCESTKKMHRSAFPCLIAKLFPENFINCAPRLGVWNSQIFVRSLLTWGEAFKNRYNSLIFQSFFPPNGVVRHINHQISSLVRHLGSPDLEEDSHHSAKETFLRWLGARNVLSSWMIKIIRMRRYWLFLFSFCGC